MRAMTSLGLVLLVAGLGTSCRIRSTTTPLAVDQQAPAFTLPNQSGQEVTLSSLTARGPAVLVFNRGHQ